MEDLSQRIAQKGAWNREEVIKNMMMDNKLEQRGD